MIWRAGDALADETDEDREIRVRTPADKAEEAAAKNGGARRGMPTGERRRGRVGR